MARRDDVLSRNRTLWTAFCLVILSLGLSSSASGTPINVTNTNDTGPGSLRQAITTANGDTDDTINITATGTITPLTALPVISANTTIAGPGVANLTVSGNNSTTVGTVFTIDSGVAVSISGLTIANGSSSGGGGGIVNAGTLTLSDCALSNNQAADDGGGIVNNGTLTVNGCTFSGNSSAAHSGGIRNLGTLTVVNSTFSGNSDADGGGGIGNVATLAVTNSTFSNNSTGGGGGGIFNSGTATLTNDIVSGNTGASGSDDIQGTYTNGGGNVVGVSPINLAPLGSYGGPTQTLLPLPNSAAICAGTAGAVTGDQRGFLIASTYCPSGKIDSGAVQTSYTAIQFTNKGASGYAGTVNSPVNVPAAPIVSVTENGLNQGGVPVTLTFTGAGTPSGLGPVPTTAGTGATFNDLSVNEAGTGTLTATLTPGSANLSASANLQIVAITLTPPAGAVPGATKGSPYALAFLASGGSTSTYTYSLSVTSGSMPPGLAFNQGTATLSGTPTATGTVGFTVTATDSNNFSGSQGYTLTANPPVTASQAIPSKTLTVNQSSVSFTPVTASGGTAPLSYSISPNLPAGLTLNTTTGAITGTPTAASGALSYTVTVTDRNSSTASASFALTVNAAVTATQAITTPVILTSGQSSVSLTPVTGSGGTAPLTYTISPSLPMGLSLNPSTGVITGSPMMASAQIMYTVTVTDSNQATATGAFSLTVNSAVKATQAVPSTTLTVNQPAVSFTPVTGSGGTAPLSYGVSPNLPSGLSLNASTGALTGIPAATSATTAYTVTVTDVNHATATANFSLTVNGAVTATQAIATVVLTANHAPTPFTPVTGSGGTAPLTYTVSPSLPAGLSLSPSTGVISGTPTASSPAMSYAVTVTDGNHATATASFSLTVNTAVMAAISVPTTMLTVSQSPAAFTPVTGSGGTAPLVYTINPSLPGGLSFSSSTGAITGTPTAANPATNYAVTVTDKNQATATANFSLTVNAAVTATATIPAETLMVNQVASFMPVTGAGGTAPLRYAITPSLPTGLNLNMSTGAITGTETAIFPTTTFTVTITDANQVMAQANFTLAVTPAITNVAVSSSSTNNTSTVDNSVTFTAKVTPFSGAAPIPPPYPGSAAPVTGSVTFTDNGNSICSSPVSVVNVSGTNLYEATCTTPSLQAATSPHTILATYNGNSNYNSSSSAVTQTVTPANSSTALASVPNPSIVSNPKNASDMVTLTATVAPAAAAVPLSGKVSFTDGGNVISGCSAVSVTPSTGVATCVTTFISGGLHSINATYASDLNYTGSSTPKPVTQSVQDFSLTVQNVTAGTPASGQQQVTITHSFTNITDPISPQTVNVTVTSIQGFATTPNNPLTITCAFTAVGTPSGATPPTCAAAPLAISPSTGAQTSLPITIDATNATPGSYSLIVNGTDPSTGLSRPTVLNFTVYVSFISPTPVTLSSGATTDTSFNFTLPAGLSIPLNCNFATISPGVIPVPTSSIPIACTVSPASIGAAGSTSLQSIPVTVTINTGGGGTSQLVTQTNVFFAGVLGVPIVALIGLLTRGKKPGKNFLRFLSVIFILAVAFGNIGCGGNFNRTATLTNTTPAGVYYLIVQGPGTANAKQAYEAVIQVNVIR